MLTRPWNGVGRVGPACRWPAIARLALASLLPCCTAVVDAASYGIAADHATADGGLEDGGQVVVGQEDSGQVDGAQADAGRVDDPKADAGQVDGAQADSGQADAGPSEVLEMLGTRGGCTGRILARYDFADGTDGWVAHQPAIKHSEVRLESQLGSPAPGSLELGLMSGASSPEVGAEVNLGSAKVAESPFDRSRVSCISARVRLVADDGVSRSTPLSAKWTFYLMLGDCYVQANGTDDYFRGLEGSEKWYQLAFDFGPEDPMTADMCPLESRAVDIVGLKIAGMPVPPRAYIDQVVVQEPNP